jgi:hypothetical protein
VASVSAAPCPASRIGSCRSGHASGFSGVREREFSLWLGHPVAAQYYAEKDRQRPKWRKTSNELLTAGATTYGPRRQRQPRPVADVDSGQHREAPPNRHAGEPWIPSGAVRSGCLHFRCRPGHRPECGPDRLPVRGDAGGIPPRVARCGCCVHAVHQVSRAGKYRGGSCGDAPAHGASLSLRDSRGAHLTRRPPAPDSAIHTGPPPAVQARMRRPGTVAVVDDRLRQADASRCRRTPTPSTRGIGSGPAAQPSILHLTARQALCGWALPLEQRPLPRSRHHFEDQITRGGPPPDRGRIPPARRRTDRPQIPQRGRPPQLGAGCWSCREPALRSNALTCGDALPRG